MGHLATAEQLDLFEAAALEQEMMSVAEPAELDPELASHRVGAAGWPVERLAGYLVEAQIPARPLPFPLTRDELDQIAAAVIDIDGNLLTRQKVFTRNPN